MRIRCLKFLAAGVSVALSFSTLGVAHSVFAAYADPPQTTPAPPFAPPVVLLDLTGAAAPPITLARGASPAPGLFAPAGASGPSLCAGGNNAFAAAVQCVFTDNDPAPGFGWNGEWVIHNPNAAAVSFYAAFFDGWGNVYAGRATLGKDSSLWVDMLTADVSPPHFSELGVTRAWAASTIPVPMDVSFSVSEGVAALPAPTFGCPQRVFSIGGLTPQGEFGCRFRFFTDPAVDSWLPGDQGDLPRFGISDPDDLERFSDLLQPIPEPSTWTLLFAGLAMMTGAIRRARS